MQLHLETGHAVALGNGAASLSCRVGHNLVGRFAHYLIAHYLIAHYFIAHYLIAHYLIAHYLILIGSDMPQFFLCTKLATGPVLSQSSVVCFVMYRRRNKQLGTLGEDGTRGKMGHCLFKAL